MLYVFQGFFLVWVCWFIDPALGMLGSWALLGAGIGVSASQRRGYPLQHFAGVGAVLGLFALVLYLAPRRHVFPDRLVISDEAFASVQQAIRDEQAFRADQIRAELRRPGRPTA